MQVGVDDPLRVQESVVDGVRPAQPEYMRKRIEGQRQVAWCGVDRGGKQGRPADGVTRQVGTLEHKPNSTVVGFRSERRHQNSQDR